jgi:uncharacterized protein YybS (DUF2232 family)
MGKAIAATVIMGLCVALVPILPVFIFPFLALPVALVVARWGIGPGLAVAVAAGLLVYAGVGLSAVMLVFLLVVGVGALLGESLRRDWSFARTFGSTALSALLAFVLWGLFIWAVLGVHFASIKTAVYDSIDSVAGQYQAWGMSAASTDSVTREMKSLFDVVPYLAPGLAAMAAVLLAACSLGLAYRIFPRLREKVSVPWSFSRFRLHWGVAYVSIAGLAMLLFSRGDATWRTVLMYAGIDLLLVSQTLFFVQGLAVVHWFAVGRRVGRGARVALYVAAVLAQLVCQLTGLMGLLDTWIDYRKRFALKGPLAGPQGGIHKE